jgi:hypothetical protein
VWRVRLYPAFAFPQRLHPTPPRVRGRRGATMQRITYIRGVVGAGLTSDSDDGLQCLLYSTGCPLFELVPIYWFVREHVGRIDLLQAENSIYELSFEGTAPQFGTSGGDLLRMTLECVWR